MTATLKRPTITEKYGVIRLFDLHGDADTKVKLLTEDLAKARREGYSNLKFEVATGEIPTINITGDRPMTDAELKNYEFTNNLKNLSAEEKRRAYEELAREFSGTPSKDDVVIVEQPEITGTRVVPDESCECPYTVLAYDKTEGGYVYAKVNGTTYIFPESACKIEVDTSLVANARKQVEEEFKTKFGEDPKGLEPGALVRVTRGNSFFETDNFTGMIVRDLGGIVEVVVDIFGKDGYESAAMPAGMLESISEEHFIKANS